MCDQSCPVVAVIFIFSLMIQVLHVAFVTTSLKQNLELIEVKEKIPQFQCPVAMSSLDPRFVYLVDAGKMLYIWVGKKSKGVTKTKSR